MSQREKKLYQEILRRRGMMLVVAAPPGCGKNSIIREVLKRDDHTKLSVSATTRDKRPGETEGVDYFFVSEDKFRDMIDKDELIEYAQIYTKAFSGTPRANIEENLENGIDMISDIDWQGHIKFKATMPDDVVSIYILPPEFKELERRMVKRGRDSAEDIERRMQKAVSEISHYKDFQYIVINDDLDQAVDKVLSIITAERLSRLRLRNLDNFVEELKPTE